MMKELYSRWAVTLLLALLPLAANAIIDEGECYIVNDFYDMALTANSDGAPRLMAYDSASDSAFIFVVEASGTEGYVMLRHKASGCYLTASTSNTWSVLLTEETGTGDEYLWELDQRFSTTIVSKKNTSARLGCDFSNGSTYYWSADEVPVYYNKSAGALNWFSVIPANGERYSASQVEARTATFENEYGINEQTAYRVTEPVSVDSLDFHIISSTPFADDGSVNLESRAAWLVFEGVRPSTVISSWLKYVTINGATAKNGTNCRVEIYLRGAAVIPLSDEDPFVATTADGETFSVSLGNTEDLGEWSNKAHTFVLKRGYMATLATAASGEDYSRVYVADHEDLEVTLPTPLDQRVTSVYVRKWHYTAKSGYAGGSTGATETCGGTWYWNWDANSSSSNNLEYIPIKQHLYWPSDDKFYNSSFTAMMMFNEPNHSEQHTSSTCSCGGTISSWTAYTQTPKFNATGLRIGSPSETTVSYISEYLTYCDNMKQRCDFACAHGYWTSEWWTDFYTLIGYGRPVWITEWEYGASWTTSYTPSSLNEYAEKVLTVLDLMEYNSKVERYSYYGTDTGGTNGWMRELFWDCDYTKGTANAGTVYKKVKPHLGYSQSAQVTPNWWTPSTSTPSITAVSLQDGEYELTCENGNGDCTGTLVAYMQVGDEWVEVGSITDRSELESTTQTIALSSDVTEGAVLKVVLTTLFSTTEIESATYEIPIYRTFDDLQNLDFDEGTFVGKGILTYAKDITDEDTQSSGMQDVEGWTMAVDNGDARAAGQYEWGSAYCLGSADYIAPTTSSDGTATGGAFGVVSVWTAQTQYVQYVTLPAGDYVMTMPIYNAGGTTALSKNLFGFIAEDDTEYLLSSTTYTVGEWTTETLSFTLAEETNGKLSIGYTAVNKGSSAMPHLFLDYIKIDYTEPVNAISAATASTTATQGATYDMNGRKVQSATGRGIYILDGKKFLK